MLIKDNVKEYETGGLFVDYEDGDAKVTIDFNEEDNPYQDVYITIETARGRQELTITQAQVFTLVHALNRADF